MNRPAYIVVIHRDGKQKALVSATAVMLLLCGAAVAEDCPIMPLQVVLMLAFGLTVVIYSYVSYKEPWEKRGGNKK